MTGLVKYAKTQREREILGAYDKVGAVRKAAVIASCDPTNARNIINRAKLQSMRDGVPVSNNPLSAPQDLKTIKELKKEVSGLQKVIESQQKALEESRKPKVNLGGRRLTVKGGSDFVRVIIPDSHGCKINKPAAEAFLADLESLKPKEIVMLGDHIDCGGFLAEHHVMGYVDETGYSYSDDIAATNEFLDQIQKAVGKVDIHYLAGNHERRIERWCVTETLRNKKDAAMLLRHFGVPSVLSLEKRGIKYYDQGKFVDDCPIPATIKLGKCNFTHGSRTGRYSAMAMLTDFGGNVVYGHVHTIDSAGKRTVNEGTIGSWCVGALCELQPYWQHTQITNWANGYGIQFVSGCGSFLHVTVPVVNGKSLLLPLTRHIA